MVALTAYDNGYIKTIIRTYGDKVYTNFHNSNMREGSAEYESFMTSIDSLLFLRTNITCKYI